MKRESLAPVAVVAVTVLFGLVCFLVWATRGRNVWLVRRKLAVGATLLGLTWAAAGCGDGPGGTTCYVPASTDLIVLDGLAGDEIVIGPEGPRTVDGRIIDRLGSVYSFLVADAAMPDSVRQRGDIAAADGSFDEAEEAFTIQIAADLPAGDYRLSFYRVSAAEATPGSEIWWYLLRILAPATSGQAAPASRAAGR
jgi:hypothetical protein